MFTLELSYHVFQIPNNAYNAVWLMLENNEKEIMNISVPYLEVQCFTGTIQI